MNILVEKCNTSVFKLKNLVDTLRTNLRTEHISSELEQKFNNFFNQLQTYEKNCSRE